MPVRARPPPDAQRAAFEVAVVVPLRAPVEVGEGPVLAEQQRLTSGAAGVFGRSRHQDDAVVRGDPGRDDPDPVGAAGDQEVVASGGTVLAGVRPGRLDRDQQPGQVPPVLAAQEQRVREQPGRRQLRRSS